MADNADPERREPQDEKKPTVIPAQGGEDVVFPDGFRKLMRGIFGPWNRRR